MKNPTAYVMTVVMLIVSLFVFGCAKKVAEGEGWSISADEFRDMYESLPPEVAPILSTPEGKKQYLENLVMEEILYHEAGKEGILDDPYVMYMAEKAKRSVIIEEYLRRELSKGLVTPSTEDILAFYEENKDAFDNAETIRVRHILVDTQEEAEEILELLNEGESFNDLAREYSICPTGPDGGDLGFFKRGDMIAEFEDAAFALEKPGDISDIVKTKYGYHIIKMEDKDHLLEQYYYDSQDEIIMNHLKKLKEASEYTIYEDNLGYEE
ncbi:MAG: peptidylprolyl isomerase [Deltaproteobacteria bacterium]|nr:peptidylprolyl isomerase [Candidatus Zymogenaceae bacterium]